MNCWIKKDFLDAMPDVIATGCASCNEKQKEMSNKIMDHLITKRPELYKNIESKYDPTGSYLKKFRMQT